MPEQARGRVRVIEQERLRERRTAVYLPICRLVFSFCSPPSHQAANSSTSNWAAARSFCRSGLTVLGTRFFICDILLRRWKLNCNLSSRTAKTNWALHTLNAQILKLWGSKYDQTTELSMYCACSVSLNRLRERKFTLTLICSLWSGRATYIISLSNWKSAEESNLHSHSHALFVCVEIGREREAILCVFKTERDRKGGIHHTIINGCCLFTTQINVHRTTE